MQPNRRFNGKAFIEVQPNIQAVLSLRTNRSTQKNGTFSVCNQETDALLARGLREPDVHLLLAAFRNQLSARGSQQVAHAYMGSLQAPHAVGVGEQHFRRGGWRDQHVDLRDSCDQTSHIDTPVLYRVGNGNKVHNGPSAGAGVVTPSQDTAHKAGDGMVHGAATHAFAGRT
jgi:hypothetical protein